MKKLFTILAIAFTSAVFAQEEITGLTITTAVPIAEDLVSHTGIKVHLKSAEIREDGYVKLTFSTMLSDSTNCTPSLISNKVVELYNVDYDWTTAYLLLKGDFLSKTLVTQNEH